MARHCLRSRTGKQHNRGRARACPSGARRHRRPTGPRSTSTSSPNPWCADRNDLRSSRAPSPPAPSSSGPVGRHRAREPTPGARAAPRPAVTCPGDRPAGGAAGPPGQAPGLPATLARGAAEARRSRVAQRRRRRPRPGRGGPARCAAPPAGPDRVGPPAARRPCARRPTSHTRLRRPHPCAPTAARGRDSGRRPPRAGREHREAARRALATPLAREPEDQPADPGRQQ